MAANDGLNKTSYNDLVQGVDIDAIILGMAVQPRIFQDVAYINPQVMKPTWRIARRDLITVNTTLAEADEAAFTSFTTNSNDITPGVYPVRSHVSGELIQDIEEGIEAVSEAIGSHAEVILNAIDSNVLGQISNATNTTDHNGVALDKSKFEAAHLLLKKQNPTLGKHIFVGGYKQIADVIGAYGNAGGAVYSVAGVASGAVASDPSSFYRQEVGGVGLFEGRVPASGGADVSGAFMIKGRTLALGYWQKLGFKLTDPAGRVGVEVMTWSRYGTGYTRQENMREVISLA